MGFLSDLIGGITGGSQAKAARQAAETQAEAAGVASGQITDAGQRAQDFLSPFAQLGRQGLNQAGFLGDPQAQFDFLQNNPLFQFSLEQAQRPLIASAAAGGRLTAGDTLEDLQRSALVASSPLIDRQRSDILNLLGIGQNTAAQQAGVEQGIGRSIADLTTGAAAARAAGTVGAANARGGILSNVLNLASIPLKTLAPEGSIAGGIGSIFSGFSGGGGE